MSVAPILLLIYNRSSTTELVFDAIRNAKPPVLYVAANAPNPEKPGDREKCEMTREIVSKIDWDCQLTTLFRTEHISVGLSVSSAINWFFQHNNEGIILEDDCVPNSDFFEFATLMLNKFRNDKRVISINGSNLGYTDKSGNTLFYSRFMNMWGWATWRDRASEIDYTLAEWKQTSDKQRFLYSRLRKHLFDIDLGWYRLWEGKLNRVASDPNFTWDWQWIYHQLKHRKVSVVPTSNLISNIGFSEGATHTISSTNPAANIPTKSLERPWVIPERIRFDNKYEEYYIKWVWCYYRRISLFEYIKRKLASVYNR
jgi:hypothetical protein